MPQRGRNNPRGKGKLHKLGYHFKQIDGFAEGFSMKLERDESHYTSYFGALSTIVVACFMLGFCYTKMLTLLGRKDVDIIESTQDFHFPDSDQFSAAKDNFFLAAAITRYDSNRTLTESKEYGELIVEHYGWGNAALGYSYGSHKLNNHICTDEELGFVRGPRTRIFPIFDRSIAEVQTYAKKFKCVDEKDLVIWGDYNSAMAMQLAVKFKMCEGHDYCKTRDEIRDWLSGKYIVLLYNQVRFN